jgi:hypothetical protein
VNTLNAVEAMTKIPTTRAATRSTVSIRSSCHVERRIC